MVRPERPKIAGIIVRQPPSVGAPSCGIQGRHDGISLPPDQRSVRRDGPNQRTMTQFSPATRNFPHNLEALAAEPVMTPDRKRVVEGKRVQVRVDTGGPRGLKTK